MTDLAFHQRLGHLVDRLDSAEFWPSLATFLGKFVQFDSWVVLIFRTGAPPIVLHEGGGDDAGDALFLDYANSLYVLDPFYRFSLGTFSPGLFRIDDVAPEHFRETEYFTRYFVHNVVTDEIQFLTPLPEFGILSLSLGGQAKFTDVEIGALCLYTPWLLPLMRHAARIDGNGALNSPGPQNDRGEFLGLEDWLREKASPPLTDREVQTTVLILGGHSAKSIANQMGISPETVKIHKRNLYRKLGVSSQAGIFAQFVRRVT
ncbi:MAG TPA: helix-turn-helix transcriptional regulator [Acidiphilium sp.]